MDPIFAVKDGKVYFNKSIFWASYISMLVEMPADLADVLDPIIEELSLENVGPGIFKHKLQDEELKQKLDNLGIKFDPGMQEYVDQKF